jgi:TolB protein
MKDRMPDPTVVVMAMLFWMVVPTRSSMSQTSALGLFEGQGDVGQVLHPGSAVYDAEKQQYSISGSGTNMWFNQDEFHVVWTRLKGDFILSARAQFVGKGVEAHRKMGWIVRPSLDPNSSHINAAVHGDGLTSLQFRRTRGATTEEVRSSLQAPDVIQLERKGATYVMSVAKSGDLLSSEKVTDLSLGDEVYVGLFVCSHNKDVVEKAVFGNVRITVPAKDDFVPYRDYIGSRIEILDVDSGDLRVVHTAPGSLQAPNWTPDGKALIYNSQGRLYRFDLATGTASVLDTGFATANNNDHVLSFDGKWLGISHHSQDDGGVSIVYTVPVQGGQPKRITAKGPSYLHGWSPDGKSLIYTGQMDNEFDIYRISADGGQETRLTEAKGLDDGSEYTPDGKTLFFNSSRTGTMQIWRMNADGTNPQQVTSDEFNNWFPHVSPDGKRIVFLSFPKDVSPTDHPFYKHVYLRLMPITGGPSKVVAYVYGGQGTINVPSWSPDSKRVAFVSNSDLTK